MSLPPRQSCMGGWCGEELRQSCRHYLTPFRNKPSERLCMPGARDFYQRTELAPLPRRATVIPLKAATTAA